MANMLQFLRRKIKPFKKCTGNPSYSFEINNSIEHQQSTKNFSSIDDCEYTGCSNNASSKLSKKSKNRFYKKFRRSSGKKTSNNNSLNNRETTNSFSNSQCTREERFEPVIKPAIVFDSPVSSVASNHPSSYGSYSNEEIEWTCDANSYTNNDCINDLIDNTNYTQIRLSMSPNMNDNSMVTYKTKYADNSNLMNENGFVNKNHQVQSQQQSTPFDELNPRTVKRHSKVLSEAGNFNVEYRKSKAYQSQNELMHNIEASSSPLFKKMNLKHNRKCRRSNTTFTMAGMKKNKIIDYFNNLEITKPLNKFNSNKEIRTFESNKNLVAVKRPISLNDSKTSNSSESNQSKNEIEKIQDLFFYDESLLSNNKNTREATDVNVTSEKHILSTFLDSPISVITEKSDSETTTPVFRNNESKFIKMNEITSTNNSIEKFRRSSSMPGLNEPNLSIQANNSKINTLKGLEDELNMNITPKKALDFDQNDLNTNSIENLSTPIGHYSSSFEVSDEEPKPFIRGQSRNLSKNIKQMFKNVVKLQLNALSNLEKFYEAQLLKVEADRKQNLEMNPSNKEQINDFFDKQLELLEERVQVNLENITNEKKRRMSSCTSLKIEATDDDSDESIEKMSKSVQKQLFSQKLAQIISSNQCNSNGFSRRSQSKNLLELKNNLINQKNVLPSKILANQSNEYSPKSSMFKRNLSLPFKQCKQNYRRVRNESAHETNFKETSPKGDSLISDCDFSYNKNSFQYQKNSTRYNESSDDIKKAHEISQIQRFTSNNMAKIVKLNIKPDEKKNFSVSANSAFRPIRKEHSAHNLGSVEAYEDMYDNEEIFKPISLDVRRNSSIFYNEAEPSEKRNMPVPRLSDSHLLFKIKQEKRLNDRKIMSNCYQKQYQSKNQNLMTRSVSKTNFHIETEV